MQPDKTVFNDNVVDLIRLLEEQARIEEQIKKLRPLVLKQAEALVETDPDNENLRRYRAQDVGNGTLFDVVFSVCKGQNRFQQKLAQEKFPELKSDDFYKRGDPFQKIDYKIRL